MKTTGQLFAPLKLAGCKTSLSGMHMFGVLPAAALAFALIWPFGGEKKIEMNSAKEVPAANGVIHYKTTDNGNVQVKIEAKSLAQPSALSPPENTYVVWFQPPGKGPIDQGALKVDGNLNGSFKTVTPYKTFKVLITAEKFAQPEQPNGLTVLSAQVSE